MEPAPITAGASVLHGAPAPAQQPEGSPFWPQPVLVPLTSSPAIQVLEKQPQDPAAWNNLGNATAGETSRAFLPAWGTPLECTAVHLTALGQCRSIPNLTIRGCRAGELEGGSGVLWQSRLVGARVRICRCGMPGPHAGRSLAAFWARAQARLALLH